MLRVDVPRVLRSSQAGTGGRDTPGWVELHVAREPPGLEASGLFLSAVLIPTQPLAMGDGLVLLSLSVPVCEMGMKVAVIY